MDSYEGKENYTFDDRLYELPAASFKIVQKGHEKRGISYKYPLKHPMYSSELQQKLTNLTEEEQMYLQIKSLNRRNTNNIIHKYRKYNPKTL